MTKILIIVDMQNDFITGPLGNDDCRNAVKGCVELAKSDEFAYTIYTRDTHFEDYLETLEGKKLPVTHCIHETEGWELIPELAELQKNKHAFVVNKTTFGSTVRLNDGLFFTRMLQVTLHRNRRKLHLLLLSLFSVTWRTDEIQGKRSW